jgi:hypothetical protein
MQTWLIMNPSNPIREWMYFTAQSDYTNYNE